jgi:hypothetical protein
MTDRAGALRALRPSRTDGLPPPPPPLLEAASDGPVGLTASSPPKLPASEGGSGQLDRQPGHDVDQRPPGPVADDLSVGGMFTLMALLQDPAAACRAIGGHREAMPARPLNVDLTPETATAFDDRCRTLRLKKKDVVELLLRGWLTATPAGNLPR